MIFFSRDSFVYPVSKDQAVRSRFAFLDKKIFLLDVYGLTFTEVISNPNLLEKGLTFFVIGFYGIKAWNRKDLTGIWSLEIKKRNILKQSSVP